jgi:hypothetical protein
MWSIYLDSKFFMVLVCAKDIFLTQSYFKQ